jgi:hypothetical protein
MLVISVTPYASAATILFQRLSVIVVDIALFAAIIVYSRSGGNNTNTNTDSSATSSSSSSSATAAAAASLSSSRNKQSSSTNVTPVLVSHDGETRVPRHSIVLLLTFANPALLFIDRMLTAHRMLRRLVLRSS